MRVLWFEVSEPSGFKDNNLPVRGWQDALQVLIAEKSDIELGIAFETSSSKSINKKNGVTYFPINPNYSIKERIKNKYRWDKRAQKLMPYAIKVINEFNPDIIHVFGSEWCWGQIAKITNIPVVIHLQGSIPSYINSLYPPGYSYKDDILSAGLNIKKILSTVLSYKSISNRAKMEEDTLKNVRYYMGRTKWDHNIVKFFNPSAQYYHVEEALRPAFYGSNKQWAPTGRKKLRLISTGCGTFWKGCDTMIKTAKALCDAGIDFEWLVVGNMTVKKQVEKKEKIKFEDVNISLLGYKSPEELTSLLTGSDIYIHTAYIDNSPNAICEAQYLGLPIISTNVGGIPSLVENGEDGILLGANDPIDLASTIINLTQNPNLQKKISDNARARAIKRHNPDSIIRQLTICYQTIINDK